MSDARTRDLERRWKASGALADELAFRQERFRARSEDPHVALAYAECLSRAGQSYDDALAKVRKHDALETILSDTWILDVTKAGRFARLLSGRESAIKDEHYFAVWVVRNRCVRLADFDEAVNAGGLPVLYARLPHGGLMTLNSIRDELISTGLSGGRPYGHASSRQGRVAEEGRETFGVYINISDTPVGVEVDVPWGLE